MFPDVVVPEVEVMTRPWPVGPALAETTVMVALFPSVAALLDAQQQGHHW